MAEVKKKIPVFGNDVDVTEVPVKTAVEYFNEYELEDGSHIVVKSVPQSIMRVDGQFLPDGSPIYIVVTSPVVRVEKHVMGKKPEKAG